jgi:hypothetical protein
MSSSSLLDSVNPPFEDRGAPVEKVIKEAGSLSVEQKTLVAEYLTGSIKKSRAQAVTRVRRPIRKTSTLAELVSLYPNVDFSGFIVRPDDKEHYQLWKLIDAFDQVAAKIGIHEFSRLHLALIVFGNRITYVSDGSIKINYERFSKSDLVKKLLRMFQSQ